MRRHLALVALLLGLLAVAAPSTFAAGPKQKDNDTHRPAARDQRLPRQPRAELGRRASRCASRDTRRPSTVDAGPVAPVAPSTSPPMSRRSSSATRTRSIVGAGDLIGASPLLSGLFHDEPTIEAMNAMGMDVTGRRQPRVRRGRRRAPAHAERRLPPDRRLPGRHAVLRLALPVPGRERALRGHAEHDPAGVRDQEVRQRQDRVHRADAQGDAADRDAGRRRRPRVRARGADGQPARHRRCARTRASAPSSS